METRSIDCLNEQVKVISVFYIVYIILDFLMQIIGNEIIDDQIKCQDRFVIIPANNVGAAYFLFQNILSVTFTVMVLLVFYRIPDKYRLIVRFKNTKIKGSKGQSGNKSRENENEDASFKAGDGITVERLLADHIEGEAIEQEKIRMSGMLDASRSISTSQKNTMRMSGQNMIRLSGSQTTGRIFQKEAFPINP